MFCLQEAMLVFVEPRQHLFVCCRLSTRPVVKCPYLRTSDCSDPLAALVDRQTPESPGSVYNMIGNNILYCTIIYSNNSTDIGLYVLYYTTLE